MTKKKLLEEIKEELEKVLRVCDTVECYHIGIAKVINEKLDEPLLDTPRGRRALRAFE